MTSRIYIEVLNSEALRQYLADCILDDIYFIFNQSQNLIGQLSSAFLRLYLLF